MFSAGNVQSYEVVNCCCCSKFLKDCCCFQMPADPLAAAGSPVNMCFCSLLAWSKAASGAASSSSNASHLEPALPGSLCRPSDVASTAEGWPTLVPACAALSCCHEYKLPVALALVCCLLGSAVDSPDCVGSLRSGCCRGNKALPANCGLLWDRPEAEACSRDELPACSWLWGGLSGQSCWLLRVQLFKAGTALAQGATAGLCFFVRVSCSALSKSCPPAASSNVLFLLCVQLRYSGA